jgi:hypothetical protein
MGVCQIIMLVLIGITGVTASVSLGKTGNNRRFLADLVGIGVLVTLLVCGGYFK